MAAIALLRRAGIDVAIMTTVSRCHYKDIPLLIDEVAKNKAVIFAFSLYCPSMEDRDTCCSPAIRYFSPTGTTTFVVKELSF